MKKIMAVFSAFIICLTFGVNAFADVLGPSFDTYEVVVTNPDGASDYDDKEKTVPCGTILTVTGEFNQAEGTVLYCSYTSEATGKTEYIQILESDTGAYNAAETTTEPETIQKPSKPATATTAPVTEPETEATTEKASETKEQETAKASSLTESEQTDEAESWQTESGEAKESEKPGNTINTKSVIISCATISGLIALMATVTTIYIKKKKA